MKIAVTGGGSGGHLSPALAVIQKIREFKPQAKILYIGGRLGMENTNQPSIEQEVIPQTDIPHVFIYAGKLQRRWAISSVFLLIGAIPGFLQALFYLSRFKPAVLFSTGGYVSVPVVFSAWLLRVPVIIHEQTATVGLSNKIGARFAREVYVSFASSVRHFPAGKTSVSGNPLRSEIVAVMNKQRRIEKHQQQQQLPMLYITGGAQGSHFINKTVEEILSKLLEKYRLIWQCGDNHRYRDFMRLKRMRENLPDQLNEHLKLVKYVGPEDIGDVFHQADLVVGRSGANTVNEIMALGLPAIFIPIPWVTNNEQYKNARILVNAGSAVILSENQLNGESLLKTINEVMDNYDEYWQKAEAIRASCKLHAAEFLAQKILAYGSNKTNC